MGCSSSIIPLSLMRSFFPGFLLLLSLSSLCLVKPGHAGDHGGISTSHFMDVHVSSLLPLEESTCNPSPRGKRQGVSLEVVHKHGPCSKHKSPSIGSTLSHSDILLRDQQRVDSIHARISGQSVAADKVVVEGKSATLPTKSGATIGSGNYIVSVGFGTPKKDLSLVFDTGSDLTWTQCQPCAKSCYEQVDPKFNPAASSSYVNISCTSPVCNQLVAATGVIPSCTSSGTCIYGIQYGDSSFSVGFFAKERLTLTSTDYIDSFFFGCGENNQGLFGGSAGLLGLGRDKLSAVSQAAGKYGNYFSYCLPRGSSNTGHLTFGKGGTRATNFSQTPLLSSSKVNNFYFLDLQSISVGGRRLSISPTVFSTASSLIDSGTVITRLPPQAYSALSSAFKQYMSKYPSAPALSILDTCFDLTNYQTVSVPKITLSFRGGAAMDLPLSGILYASKISQVCLAFAGNGKDTSPTILGNVQQQTFDIVYDVDGGMIGFGPNGC